MSTTSIPAGRAEVVWLLAAGAALNTNTEDCAAVADFGGGGSTFPPARFTEGAATATMHTYTRF